MLFVLVRDIESGFGSSCASRSGAKTTQCVVFRAWTYAVFAQKKKRKRTSKEVRFVLVGDIESGFGSSCASRSGAKTTHCVVFRAWTYAVFAQKKKRKRTSKEVLFVLVRDIERALANASARTFTDATIYNFYNLRTFLRPSGLRW